MNAASANSHRFSWGHSAVGVTSRGPAGAPRPTVAAAA